MISPSVGFSNPDTISTNVDYPRRTHQLFQYSLFYELKNLLYLRRFYHDFYLRKRYLTLSVLENVN